MYWFNRYNNKNGLTKFNNPQKLVFTYMYVFPLHNSNVCLLMRLYKIILKIVYTSLYTSLHRLKFTQTKSCARHFYKGCDSPPLGSNFSDFAKIFVNLIASILPVIFQNYKLVKLICNFKKY